MGGKTTILGRLGAASTLLAGTLLFASPAHANPIHGIGSMLFGVLQAPFSVLAGTFGGPPVIGTIAGAVSGTTRAVGLVANGALELAGDGVAVARMIGPFLLPFLF